MKHSSRWDLPKGHLDPGETKPQAALRELVEETGLKPTDIWIDDRFVFENRYIVNYKRTSNKRLLKELTIYLGFLKEDREIVATEHEGHAWFDWQPPHQIQPQTIDPLLEQVTNFLETQSEWPPKN